MALVEERVLPKSVENAWPSDGKAMEEETWLWRRAHGVGGFAATFHSARLAVEDKFNMHSKLHRTHARRAARTQRLTKTPASDYDPSV